jgi:hypothetical protein
MKNTLVDKMAQSAATKTAINFSSAKRLFYASNTQGKVPPKALDTEFERHRHIPPVWIPISPIIFGFAYWHPNEPMPRVIEAGKYSINVPEFVQGKKNVLLGYETLIRGKCDGIFVADRVSILSLNFPTQSEVWRKRESCGLPIGPVSSENDPMAFLLLRCETTISAPVRGDIVITKNGGRTVHMEYAPTSAFPIAVSAEQPRKVYPTGVAKYVKKRLLRSETKT